METIYYSRDRDGNLPVIKIDDKHYEIHKPDRVIQCNSARQLIINLTGHPQARNWTFNRYFRQGIYTLPDYNLEPVLSLNELFEPGGIVLDSGILLTGLNTSDAITIQPVLGIDLDKRGDEVAKLLFAGFRGWIKLCQYDPEDVLQEVYKGILIRNKGTCPFDARKASFGHYVHQICHCVLSNYHRKESKHSKAEQVGMMTCKDGAYTESDVSEAIADTPSTDPRLLSTLAQDLNFVLSQKPTFENRVALQVLPLLDKGYTQNDMVNILGLNRNLITKALETIRQTTIRCGYSPTKEREL